MIGMTQREFWEMCCIPGESYKTIIDRQNRNGGGLTAEIATRIAALTGVAPGHLMRNQIRPDERRGEYTLKDYELYKKRYDFSDDDDWERELINVVQTRFEEAVDCLEKRKGVSFLSALFFLSDEVDQLTKTLGVFEDDNNNLLGPTADEIMATVAKQVPENSDQPASARFRRWEIENFSEWMKKAKKEAKAFREKPPEERRLKGTKKPKQ